MRAVLQRVREATVQVDGATVGAIGPGPGLLVFLAVAPTDSAAEVAWMTEKTVQLRIFEDAAGKMNRSLIDVAGSVLVVSQFTLYGDCRKGRRPSFLGSARPETAIPLYEAYLAALRQTGLTVAAGQFGADMQVTLINDGPVTLILDIDAKTATEVSVPEENTIG